MEYLGPPSLPARQYRYSHQSIFTHSHSSIINFWCRYEILKSCLDELTSRKIIVPSVKISSLSWPLSLTQSSITAQLLTQDVEIDAEMDSEMEPQLPSLHYLSIDAGIDCFKTKNQVVMLSIR